MGNGGISGTPLNGSAPAPFNHTGLFDGGSTIIWQRSDGINIVVLFNQNQASGSDFSSLLAQEIDLLINIMNLSGSAWPTQCVDGFWVDPTPAVTSFYGAYDQPFEGMQDALNYVTDGSKLRLLAGSTSWTGTLSKRLLLDAPEGTIFIGQ